VRLAVGKVGPWPLRAVRCRDVPPLRVFAVGVTLAGLASCSLVTSIDDLSQGAATDASTSDASSPDAPDQPSEDAGPCRCPAGTTDTNGVCVVIEPTAAGYACASPIVVPACERSYEARLCATHAQLAYDGACGGVPRQSVFFVLGQIGALPDGGARRWLVNSSGTEVLARTNAACTVGSEPCAQGPSPGGDLAGGGATLAWGKAVTVGCTTVRLDIQPK
jgi:hypothetical protein